MVAGAITLEGFNADLKRQRILRAPRDCAFHNELQMLIEGDCSMSTIREKLIVIAGLAAFSPTALAFDRPEESLMSLRQDQVTASFQRMLTHAPNPVAPATPADFELDPLIDALAIPLLRWRAATRMQTAMQAGSDASGSQCSDVPATGGPAMLVP